MTPALQAVPTVSTPPWWTSLNAWSQIATIAVGVFALIALYQLVIARRTLTTTQNDISIRNQREAASRAVDVCQRFADKTIPQFGAVENALKSAGAPLVVWALKDYTFSPQSFVDIDDADAWITRAKGQSDQVILLLNELEAFAMYFVNGIADERVAFPALSRMFVSAIERLAPALVTMRTTAVTSGQYSNTVALYELWNTRIHREALSAQRAEIDRKAATIADRQIIPLGMQR